MQAKFFIETYGCQMNIADSALVEQILLDAGYERAAALDEADIILMNTCSVRGHARERITGRMCSMLAYRPARPHLVLGLLGCVAQHEREAVLEDMPFLGLVVGPDGYRRLPALISACLDGQERQIDLRLSHKETYGDLPSSTRWEDAPAFVTVQRGCNQFCSYCVVPLVRGRERSVPPAEVLTQVRAQVAAGYREVTLLGQTVNHYRSGDTDFAALLRQVARVEGLSRLRFLSPHPLGFGPELIEVLATEPSIMPRVHLPVQSGSDAVLQRMRRGHTAAQYRTLVEALRRAVPGLALSTDILVGFPGETEAQLQETLDLLEDLRFHAAYLYRYSERPGTRAARTMPDTLPEAVKLERLDRAIQIQERVTRELLADFVGQEVEVLVEKPSRRDPADRQGSSAHGIPVVLRQAPELQRGDLARGRVVASTGHTLLAER